MKCPATLCTWSGQKLKRTAESIWTLKSANNEVMGRNIDSVRCHGNVYSHQSWFLCNVKMLISILNTSHVEQIHSATYSGGPKSVYFEDFHHLITGCSNGFHQGSKVLGLRIGCLPLGESQLR